MLILITGVPGSGKSLYSIDLIDKYIEQNKKLVEEGKPPRAIYADIDGINIDGVLSAPDDWRDCPDGSIVVYDECQQRFGSDGQGRSGRADIQEFETHRHRGFDIILITQHGKLLHSHIRRLVGRHYHVVRMYGTQNATIYAKDGHMDTDKTHQLLKEDNYVWTYPKQHFTKYKSATVHTHKAHMPKFVKRALIGLVIVIAILSFLIPKAMVFFTGAYGSASVATESELATTQIASNEAQDKPVRKQSRVKENLSPVACISNDVECVCYDKDGYKLELEYLSCVGNTHNFSSYIEFNTPPHQRAVATVGG